MKVQRPQVIEVGRPEDRRQTERDKRPQVDLRRHVIALRVGKLKYPREFNEIAEELKSLATT